MLPEVGMVVSLYVITRMLELLLGPNRRSVDGTVYTFATITAIVAGITLVNAAILTARSVLHNLWP